MSLIPKMETIKAKGEIEGMGIETKPLTYKPNKKTKLPRSIFTNNHKSLKPQNKSYLNKSSKIDRRQACTTKVSYRTSKDLHIKNLEYIQKEGKDRDGGQPELYGSLTKEEYEKQMTDINWRIILSPETDEIDLTTMTKAFIEKLEEHTGYKFKWVAANHFDTAKHHSHILIDGKDKNGRDVKFLPQNLIKNVMREYARDICTTLSGEVTDEQIRQKTENSVSKNYYTSLDKTIQKYCINRHVNDYSANKNSREITRRLDYLVSLELAEYSKEKMCYIMKEGWNEKLKQLGKYNTFLDGWNWANCPKEDYYLHEIQKNGDIEGKVIRRYTMQKDSNNFAIIIQKKDGKVAYVPLNFFPKNCLPGDEITITRKDSKTYIRNNTQKQ